MTFEKSNAYFVILCLKNIYGILDRSYPWSYKLFDDKNKRIFFIGKRKFV